MKGRTVLLVVRHNRFVPVSLTYNICRKTHNVSLALVVAQHVVSIDQDGTVRSHEVEYFSTTLTNDQALTSEEPEHGPTVVEEVKSAIKKASSTDGKLVIAEEIEKGRVTWKSMKLFFSGLGGGYPLTFFSIWISITFLTEWVDTFQVWFLGYWGSQYENHTLEVNPIP